MKTKKKYIYEALKTAIKKDGRLTGANINAIFKEVVPDKKLLTAVSFVESDKNPEGRDSVGIYYLGILQLLIIRSTKKPDTKDEDTTHGIVIGRMYVEDHGLVKSTTYGWGTEEEQAEGADIVAKVTMDCISNLEHTVIKHYDKLKKLQYALDMLGELDTQGFPEATSYDTKEEDKPESGV